MYNFLKLGSLVRGRYRIIRVLGGGGQGAVYLAEDTQNSGLQVAVKEMRTEAEMSGGMDDPEAQDERQQAINSFYREAEILTQLRHPNMPTFTDMFEENGRPYLVMEFIAGESLEKKVERSGGKPLPEREVLYYGIQVAQVLHYLHIQNPPIIFRDVKPSNIMVMPNHLVKLIDFGIARTWKAGKRRDTVSMGTAAYAPFEQFGKGQTDARSDIYSLAASLYHLLTGRPPTPATTPTTLRDLNPAITPQTEALIIRCMERDMNKRPANARIMEQELRDCLGVPFIPPQPVAPAAAPAIQPQPAAPAAPVVAQPAPAVQPQARPQPIAPAQPVAAPTPAAAASRPAPSIAPAADGRDQDLQPCPNCGRLNRAGARFCGRCGTTIARQIEAKLQVLGPRGVLWERRIMPGESPFLIGRRSLSRQIFPHMDLTYSDPHAFVSRRHAQIYGDGGGYMIEDMGSENGTFINNNRLAPHRPTVLRNGDLVQIGKVQMQFTLA